MNSLSISVAGAGIGGLTAAALLARAGHDVVVYDQFATPRPVGSGLVVQPAGQRVLERIGALESALATGAKIERLSGHATPRMNTVLDVSYGPDARPDDRTDEASAFGLSIHRAALFEALHRAATGAGAQICPALKVSGREGANRLRFENGTLSPAADLIIDALGASSPLSPLIARALPYGAIWGTVDWPTNSQLSNRQLSQRYQRATHMAGAMPLGLPSGPTPKAAIFWSLTPEGFCNWQSRPISDWQADIQDFWPEFAPFAGQISDHCQMTPAFYSHGTLRRPIAPNLAHIGDAAHRASPQLGQGANMALLDADALAMALHEAPDIETALAIYARMRRSHVRLYQLMSHLFTPQYQSDSRILPILRDYILAPVSRIPPIPRILTRLVSGALISPYGRHGRR